MEHDAKRPHLDSVAANPEDNKPVLMLQEEKLDEEKKQEHVLIAVPIATKLECRLVSFVSYAECISVAEAEGLRKIQDCLQGGKFDDPSKKKPKSKSLQSNS